ncbi:MAG: discoidin domain-containing protein [Oscillibacter sp.]|nr:discoidin domain-containing protein [Oscillibacter sp.]
MNNKTKNVVIIVLCVIIAGSLGLGAYTLSQGQKASNEPNPNVTVVAAPEQTDFEQHPEWELPEPEVIDYGENLALNKKAKQSGQTQIYNCKNAFDGSRYTYWEGKADEYPGEVTVDLEAVMDLGGAQIMLSPNQMWGARTQEVEILVSGDNENFTTVVPRTALDFDPLENGNAVYIPFEGTGQYVRFCFYSNTGATAGQAAEIEVYGPQG